MNVDFNNVRKQACFAYDRLAKKLNSKIVDDEIVVDVDEIQDHMDRLRELIMTMAWISMKDNEDFKEVGKEVQPIAWFNHVDEDE